MKKILFAILITSTSLVIIQQAPVPGPDFPNYPDPFPQEKKVTPRPFPKSKPIPTPQPKGKINNKKS